MNVQTISPLDLNQADTAAWLQMIGPGSAFESPFFHPSYVTEMARFRPQIELSVVRDGGRPVGFFAFERHGARTAKPLGLKLADFQGVVCPSGRRISIEELLSSAGLSCCHFDHWLTEQSADKYIMEVSGSPFMDLTSGYEEYLSQRRAAGSKLLSQTLRKRRKFEREVAPLTFTWNDIAPDALELLWQWKAAQRERTQSVNILDYEWVRSFLTSLCDADCSGAQGVVSTLRADGRIIAVHLGLHSHSTLHYWFPAYDTEFQRYSTGSILLLELAQECASRGISRINLGKGEDRYKDSFASGAISVATGTVDRVAMRRLVRSSLYAAKTWIKASPLQSAAQIPKRIIRRWQTQRAMQVK